jgi:cytochrome P450
MTAVPDPAPLSSEHLTCPFATDAWLRDHAPVFHVADQDVWVITRHQDIQEALRRPDLFSNRFGRVIRGRDRLTPDALAILEEGWEPVDTLFTTDPPEHRRFRGLVNKAFTARRVARMGDYIRQVTDKLLDDLVAADGPVDLVEAFAVPLPLTVIADQLGVPREDLPLFKRWSQAIVAELSRMASPDEQVASARSYLEFQRYFHQRIEERRAEPRDDILSDLVHARGDDEDERPLDDRELLMMLTQLLVAGNETTTNGISAAVWLLASRPDLQRELRRDPERIPDLVEETLRLEAPIQAMWRITTQDVEIAGTTIPHGSLVMLRYTAANRDDRHYTCPGDLDLDRPNVRDHLAFGGGIHFCVGAALARSEMTVAIEALLHRTTDVRLVPDLAIAHPPHQLIRGIQRLDVEIDRVPGGTA